MEKKALVAFHSSLGISVTKVFSEAKYQVTLAENLEEMFGHMALSKDGIDSGNRVIFDWYIMDTNLGEPDGYNCRSAERIYTLIAPEIITKRSRFMSLTGNNVAKRLAEEKNIPVIAKTNLKKLVDFYLSIRA